ncbi:MAG TPA: hypothetical protein VLT16_03345 [Candidatus Limnocylindrales bacterium]|nr:hypothetical protein [Candidatus Limnocylindrales bacterium]
MTAFRWLAAFSLLLVFSLPFSLHAQTVVIEPVGHDVSAPLRDMPVVPPTFDNFNLHMVKPVPHVFSSGPDGALQTAPIQTSATISSLSGFDGPGVSTGLSISGEPPDTNASVGATQVVVWVNTSFAVYDKATHAKVFPANGFAAGNTIWSGFTSGRCNTDNSGDPIVLYDKQAQRWIFTQFAVSTTPYFQCVAVSQTSDATGPYNRYAYSFSTNFPDYPKVGVWTDAYYFTFNLFAHAARFAGADLCALDRTTAINGGAAKLLCSATSRSFASVLPADLDGASGAAGTTALPPAGTAEYMLNFGTNSLNVWRLVPNFTAGTLSVTGPTNIPVATFAEACSGGACIPQLGVTQQLDSLGDRLMYRLSYRNFGTFASLLVNHSVTAGSSTGVRWYELRDAGAGPSVFQQGTYAPDSTFRWMGSIAQDKQGNIAAGYSVSSSSINPGIRFASRAPGDPAGQLSQETSLLAGTGSQNGHNRWGDYSSMSVDPTDDCTFYYANEWLNATGDFIWSTHVSSFKLGTCQ